MYLSLSRYIIPSSREASVKENRKKRSWIMKGLFRGTKQAAIELLRLSSAKESNLIASWFNCLFRHYAKSLHAFMFHVPSSNVFDKSRVTRVAASSSWTYTSYLRACRMNTAWFPVSPMLRRESSRFSPRACRWRSESYCYSFKYRRIRSENAHEVPT